ncbi:MAG: bifunctional riboflavin kinase/FAD synthetase [Bacteroidetes bacterium]|nr:bifunctional riboflavin kinase/FAD synthetase [Bacteroidota bacterium]MBS1974070.1 bifunctional riboflavin kinase/FAD synthetase [Bacteroidota bacterium]
MKVHRDLIQLPVFRNAIVTIGTFDGVHTGHQQIIDQLKDESKRTNGETVIITFHPHPRKIVGNSPHEIKLINTLSEKIELLEARGIDHLVVVPFNEQFSNLSAEEYIRDFLIGKFRPHTIIIGYDHRFGKGRKGDYHLLEDCCRDFKYELKEIPVHVLNEISVSSTRIRESIINADIETANKLLGYDFFFEGIVVEGNKLGRTIGYPTANLEIEEEEKIVPGNGVYAVRLSMVNGQGSIEDSYNFEAHSPFAIHHSLKGMMNIGTRPTVGGSKRTIEVNIFDFNENIYGKTLRAFIKKHLRNEQKFDGLDALKEQLAKDKKATIEFFKKG